MCGRYTFSGVSASLAQRMGLETTPEWKPSWNISPGSNVPVIHGSPADCLCELLRWGIPHPKAGQLINLRAEGKVWTSADYCPCLVPADGFYEWDATGKAWYFHIPGDTLLMAACEREGAFGIVTQAAAGPVARVHHRQPLLLGEESWRNWLIGELPHEQMLQGCGFSRGLKYHQVSARVNQTKAEGPDLCEPGGQISIWELDR